MEKPKGRADNNDKLVAKRMKYRRMTLGMSQQEVAEAIGVSIQQIQKYEKTINRISAGRIVGLAKILKVPVNYFYDAYLPEDSMEVGEKEVKVGQKKVITLDNKFFEKFCRYYGRLDKKAQKISQNMVLNLVQNLAKMY